MKMVKKLVMFNYKERENLIDFIIDIESPNLFADEKEYYEKEYKKVEKMMTHEIEEYAESKDYLHFSEKQKRLIKNE